MANTLHTGIPRLQWAGAYPPCIPSVVISCDINPFCAGDTITFTPTFNCVDTAVNTDVKFGLLYNWYAVTDVRNICAEGWEVPEKTDFDTLSTFLGGDATGGGKLKETGTTYWTTPNTGATNETKFNGRGAGLRTYITGAFQSINDINSIWTITTQSGTNKWVRRLDYNQNTFSTAFVYNLKNGLSIRLIKTTTTLSDGQTGTYTGNDGKVYRTICIGTQEWLADNLCETKYRNGDTIPEVTDNAEWAALTTGALCAYDNDWTNAFTLTGAITTYVWSVNNVLVSSSSDPFTSNSLVDGDRIALAFTTDIGNTYFSNIITVSEKTEGCETPALELTFDDIANVPVADASSVSDWNTFFDLPTYGSPFTSVEVVDDTVKLYGGSEITFRAYFYMNMHLININDPAESFESIDYMSIYSVSNLETISLNGVIAAGETSISYNNNLRVINLPKLATAGNYMFSGCVSVESISIPSCVNIGNTTGDNGVFVGITGQTITLTIPAALMTCNGGNPDGDIQWLQSHNTVTIITV